MMRQETSLARHSFLFRQPITHSDLVLSNARSSCAVVAVGSCLVVVGGRGNSTAQVLDTDRCRVWNLRSFTSYRNGCSMVNAANQVAVIGGFHNPSCATLPLMDKNTWCFRRLCEQHPNECFHSQKGVGCGDVNATTHTCHGKWRDDTCFSCSLL